MKVFRFVLTTSVTELHREEREHGIGVRRKTWLEIGLFVWLLEDHRMWLTVGVRWRRPALAPLGNLHCLDDAYGYETHWTES